MATDVGTLQSKLTLDFSQFASGMNSAISMVRSFGKQLQKALGSHATQGFSTTNQAINNVQTSVTNLQRAVASFQATMQNTNTVLAQFSNLQAHTSRMGQNLNNAAGAAQRLNASTSNIAPRITSATFHARNLSQHFNNASNSARRATTQTNRVSNSARQAGRNARTLSDNLNRSVGFAKDLKRILGGIVVSQAFYKMLGIMQDLVSSSVEFMTNMEQSAIAFKYLLGSAENSAGFLEALQDFAVSSPMDMAGAEQAARMLMTMGFEAESTISVLRVLTDAATVAGGEMSDTVYRIALALGQMLQSGTVKMQELRQLVNANIPIFDILQEELGLTSEQIANIGDASVDSGKAVMAILSGLQKRFGGASLEMQQTITGALSATKDSFYVLFNEVMSGPYEAIRQKLVSLSDAMQYLAQVARKFGAGGVFEAIVPERLHAVIRNIIGAFMQLGQAITFLGRICAEVFGGMGEIILHILNIILPPISILLNAVMQFVYGLLKAYPIIKYFFAALVLLSVAKTIGAIFLWFWKVIGLGKIIMSVVGYIQAMIKALMTLSIFMIHNPIVAALTAIVIAVGLLTGAFQKAINKIKEFFSLLGAKITTSNKTVDKNMGIGYDPNEILQPTNKETNDSAEKYKSSLDDISSKLQDVGDEANKTKNKLKNAFNQSFDEVYTINPNTSEDLGLSGLEDLDLSLPLVELDNLNNALADLGDFNFDGWVDEFMISWQGMWEKIKQRLQDFGLLALLSGILAGLLTGNPWVALATALATLFWPEICKALGLTEKEGQTLLGAAIVALLGAVIAKLAGMSWGSILVTAGIATLAYAIGSAIGGKLGELLKIDMDVYADMFNIRVVGDIIAAIAAGILAAIGVISAPLGLAIGAAILTAEICYPIGQKIYEYLSTEANWTDARINWVSCGSAIGGIIGTFIAGPFGTAVGLALGGTLGEVANVLYEGFANGNWESAGNVNWATCGTIMGTAIGTAIAPGLGSALGISIGNIVGNIANVLVAIDGDWDIAAEAFKLWGKDIADAFLDGLLREGGIFGWSTEFFEYAGECFQDAWDAFKEQDWGALGKNILEGILSGLTAAVTFVVEPISRVFRGIWDGFCALFGIHSPAKEMEPIGENILKGVLEGILGFITGIPTYIAEAGAAIITSIGGWFTGIGEKVTNWFADAKESVGTFISDTATSIGGWVTERVSDIGTFVGDTASSISTWVTDRVSDFSTFISNTGTNISNWATGTWNSISTWATNTKSSITTWASNTKSSISTWASNVKTNISTWATNAKSTITNWASNTKSSISNWVSNTKASISTWASNTKSSISTWWTNVQSKFDSFKGISFTNWCTNTLKSISDWCSNVWSSIKDKIGSAIDKIKEFLGLSGTDANVSVSASVNNGSSTGHANGGVFNREHWARFAEGNKAEAIIPLENDTAMQPFVDAVSNGVTASLAPIVATMNSGGSSNQMQPLYVGTLVADERGLKELERRMQIIRIKEERRG